MMKVNFIKIIGCFFICFSVLSCQQDEKVKDTKMFELLSNETIGIDFINSVKNTKEFNIFSYRNFYNGGGVGLGDVNNDGLTDIYLTSNMGENKLYLNEGDWKFKDVSNSAGITESGKWSTGVVMVDINGDSYLDIYVCNAGFQKGTDQKNALFINNGDLTFTESASIYGLADNGYSTHAAFFDYDLDGDLDVYMLNNSFIPANTLNYNNKRSLRSDDWNVKDFLKGGGDRFYRNDNGQFIDISEDAGIFGSLIGFGLGVTVGDVNGDRYPDIYVSNDFFERDYLYINQEGKNFSEELEERIDHLSHSSMGADMADINNDGMPEIFVTDMLPKDDYRLKTTTTFDNIDLRNLKVKQGFYNQFMQNTLQLNDGDGDFKEIAFYANVAASDWSWGALMFDADNDRFNDIYICNGIYNDVTNQDFIDFFANEVLQKMALTGKKEQIDSIISKMPSNPISNKMFRNGKNFAFSDVSEKWGLDNKSFSNGAAYGDLDNDGDLDLVVNNVNQEAFFYKNNSSSNFIAFKLKGKAQNSQAIGSKIEIHFGNEIMTKELIPSRGFQSSVDTKIIFGLGTSAIDIDSVLIFWPDRTFTKLLDYKINFINEVSQGENTQPFYTHLGSDSTLFEEVENVFDPHDEDGFTDFYYERNVPNQLSKEGPCSAIGDVNNDGLMDVFIGGADGQTPTLYLASNNKGYVKSQVPYFEKFKAFEDTSAAFFDCDGDGDLDLIVGSGGNNLTYSDRAFRDRLYINDNGVFELNYNAIPPKSVNTSIIVPFDFDNDDDLDLFVGSRSIPGLYGVSPGSSILLNNGKGQFLDVTKKIVPELSFAGMVTSATAIDLFGNKAKELVIVGEWMSPKILSFNGTTFDIIKSNLDSFSGWWQCVKSKDLNNDGLNDLFLGNMGENFYLKADNTNPLLMWINDFDKNGSIEKVITRSVDGRNVPVSMKRDLTDELAMLKKKSLKHIEFASKSINELFTPEELKSSTVKQINFMKSMVAFNKGNGNFEILPLPKMGQLSCINDVEMIDVNHDDLDDLIVAGNNEFFLPQFSQLDACRGKIFINQDSVFTFMPNKESGLNLRGVTRELKLIIDKNETKLLALRNNKSHILYNFRAK